MKDFIQHLQETKEEQLEEGAKFNKVAYERISTKMHRFIINEIKHVKARNQEMKKLDATYQKLTGKSFFHGKIYNDDPINQDDKDLLEKLDKERLLGD